jgi:YHS domain-containing protein
VIAFVFADLIVIPIVLIYRKYYGGAMTVRLVGIMFVSIVTAALLVDGIFSALDLVPTHRPSIDSISERAITFNYTAVLNIVFLGVAAALFALTLRGAKDPVCGMAVSRSSPYRSEREGETFYFCSAHCKHRFESTDAGESAPHHGPLAHAGGHHDDG